MPFFKPLLLVAGAYALYSLFRGGSSRGDDPPAYSPPPSPPPPPRSPSPRRGPRDHAKPPPPPSLLYSSPTPAPQRVYTVCQCEACQRLRRRAAEKVSERQHLSSQNLGQHLYRTESSSPAESYRSQDHHSPEIEFLRNAEASNENDGRDPYYLHLRSEAKRYHNLRGKSFDESQRAYNQRDRARAKELSNEGKQYKRLMDKFNKQASEWIFQQNNKDIGPCKFDLHGLYVQEAIDQTERILKEARARSDPLIRLIVGKGLHAEDGNAKLKPAIEKLIRNSGLSSRIDPFNTGVLIVDLDPASSGNEYFRDRTNLLSL